MPFLSVVTHGTMFILGAFLAESVRPLVARAGRALRPVAKNAIRETLLARDGLRAIAAEARAEVEVGGSGELRAFPVERRMIDE
jgi:hypothetical protein